MIVHRFCCLHSRPPQGRGSVRGEPLTGSPTRVQSPARRRLLLRSKSAAPKRIPHPTGWGILFGAGDEESAEAPPAAEEARRFRGSVPTAGRGSGWEPADTTVSAEEHAKKITTQMGGDLWSGRRGSNSLPRPWQGRALPDELRPQMTPMFQRHGASGRSRTNDTRIFSPLLYQLSYRGILSRVRLGSDALKMATRNGLEPSTSSVTGWRANRLHHRATEQE